MKKKINLKYIIIISIINWLSIISTSYSQNTDKLYEKIDLFSEVLEKVQDEYVDEIDQSEVMDSAINGILQSLDPYSSYMNPEIFKEMQTETSGEFGGLGIEVSMEAGVVKVITPIDDTPASKAGVKAGDYIVRINGEQVQGKTLMEAVNLMRGPVGSAIEITIRRKGLRKAKIIKIVREIIEIQSVVSRLIDDEIGYLRLRAFNENSSNQLKKEILKLEKNDKPVGYFGLIPHYINIRGKKFKAIATIDYYILSNYRGKGIMKIIDNYVISKNNIVHSFPNNITSKVLQKYGYKLEKNNFTMLFPVKFFLLPHYKKLKKYQKYLLRFLFFLMEPISIILRKWIENKLLNYSQHIENPSVEILASVFEYQPKNITSTIRDEEFINWRYFRSPF